MGGAERGAICIVSSGEDTAVRKIAKMTQKHGKNREKQDVVFEIG